MKYVAYGLMAAFLAAAVYGAIPDTAAGWYTPDKFSIEVTSGVLEVRTTDEYGNTDTIEYPVYVDETGYVVGMDGTDLTDDVLNSVSYKALQAFVLAVRNKERIETIGINLNELMSKSQINIYNSTLGESYTIKFSGGSLANTVNDSSPEINASSDKEDPADNRSLNWTGSNKLQLRGWATSGEYDGLWSPLSTPISIPVRYTRGANMMYYKWYGADDLSLAPEPTTHQLELKGWRTASSNVMTPLADAIKKSSKGPLDNYELVVRNSSTGLNYVSLGTLDVDMKADGKSIVTNSGEVALYGYAAAEEDSDTETPYLPFADGREHLAWQSVLDFFNTGLFNLTTDGKVNLKGVEAGQGNDVRVMTVSGGESGAAITSSSISTLIDTPLAMNGSAISVSGWSDASPGSSDTLAELLTDGYGLVNNPSHSPSLLTRTQQGAVSYMPIGLLPKPAPADGKSIVTNEDVALAIDGYDDADEGMIPYKTEGGIGWKELEALVDGVSLTTNSADGAASQGVASIYGYKTYAGRQSKHYIGTSPGKSAAFGWFELPNVTTNHVEGDRATIASYVNVPGENGDSDAKVLGLRDWNYSHSGDPLFVVNDGGTIGYMSADSLTNLAACACTQKWDAVAAWIDGGAGIDEDGDLTLPGETLDEYLYGTLGYIYCTNPNNGDLYFDNSENDGAITASFDAPDNWADGVSLDLTNGAYQIKGFANASACNATMSAMLSDPTGSDATTHLLLAKKTDTGELHYVAIGDGVKSGAEVDDTTITTNTAHGATAQGVASIRGWSDAANDTYLSKNEGGNLEWRQIVAGGAPVDDVSITTNTTHGAVAMGQASLYGFADAPRGTVPMVVNDNGTNKLGWGTTGNFGITATKSNGSWTYTVSGGYFTRARSQTYVSGITVSSSGYVYLKVPLGTGTSATIVLEGSSKSSNTTDTYILLYYCNVSTGVSDYRGAPHIQVWE